MTVFPESSFKENNVHFSNVKSFEKLQKFEIEFIEYISNLVLNAQS